MLNAYSFHDGEPVDGAVLVFAPSYKAARKIAYPAVQSFSGCEYTSVRGMRIRDDAWLKANAADPEKLAQCQPHVIDSPPTCKGCELWWSELVDGYCEGCLDQQGGKQC